MIALDLQTKLLIDGQDLFGIFTIFATNKIYSMRTERMKQ